MTSTVTIDKVYFETLLRRAEFHASPDQINNSPKLETVTVLRDEHDSLLRMAKEYSTLREALYRGGIASETLDVISLVPLDDESPIYISQVLINGSNPENEHSHNAHNINPNGTAHAEAIFAHPPASNVPTSNPYASKHVNNVGQGWRIQNLHPPSYHSSNSRHPSFSQEESSSLSNQDKIDQFYDPTGTPCQERHQYGRNEQRTLKLTGLSENVTHKDIIDVVRGGILLDIYLRGFERAAMISFVEGAKAQEFFAYARRHDIYIKNKRVEINWNDRQFILPAHVANKISIGATRNLVLRNINPNISPDLIRDHLDHIHNLVVINVKFEHNNAYISLNSVHNALFARTCMMSRQNYKGMKIEWYPDECGQPLPKIQHMLRKENYSQAPVKKVDIMVNRFQMLNMDGTEDGSDDDDEDSMTEYASMDHPVSWADTSIAA
ncbi:MAG: hypothetical protein M1834_004013 [Cirrosporium novae-zelandiae]|nr:MAG: hypothetical protein M1834_004013 [Cirrosporium novae-zelandiae]